MFYGIYDTLKVLASGGFFVRVVDMHGVRVTLYQFIDGHCYAHADYTPKAFSRLLDTGIIFYVGSGADDEGVPADFYFLVGCPPGKAPLSN